MAAEERASKTINRYVELYNSARRVNNAAISVKGYGVIIVVLQGLVGFFVGGMTNGGMFLAVAASVVWSFGVVYAVSYGLVAAGTLIESSVDCAVHSSPVLTEAQKVSLISVVANKDDEKSKEPEPQV